MECQDSRSVSVPWPVPLSSPLAIDLTWHSLLTVQAPPQLHDLMTSMLSGAFADDLQGIFRIDILQITSRNGSSPLGLLGQQLRNLTLGWIYLHLAPKTFLKAICLCWYPYLQTKSGKIPALPRPSGSWKAVKCRKPISNSLAGKWIGGAQWRLTVTRDYRGIKHKPSVLMRLDHFSLMLS